MDILNPGDLLYDSKMRDIDKHNKENRSRSQKEFLEFIKKLQNEMFAEFRKNPEDIHTPENTNYFYFSPRRNIRSGVITKDDIDELIADDSKKLLSIGTGAAFLERLLVRLGVKKKNITLCDIDPKHLPKGFPSKVFDMHGKRTELGDATYDLIIFPESVMINTGDIYYSYHKQVKDKYEILHHLISEALPHLKPNGKIKMNIQLPDNRFIKKIRSRFGRKIKKIRLKNHLLEVET